MNSVQTISGYFRSMRLQTLLTLLVLAVTVPLVLALVYLVNIQAGELLQEKSQEQLQINNEKLQSNLSGWIKSHQGLVNLLAFQPETVSMDAAKQKPFLISLAKAYPYLYLTMTTDTKGMNVARSDNESNKDYHDRTWYQEAVKGTSMSTQTVIGRTSGRPALVLAAAIRNQKNQIVGVGAVVSELDEIANDLQTGSIGETGYSYIIDELNQVVVHPEFGSADELVKLDNYPPVQALRSGVQGHYEFTDENGVLWWAHLMPLESGWGVITQQQRVELIQAETRFQVTTAFLAVGALIWLVILALLVVRRSLRPVAALTEKARAVAAGDLDQIAPVYRDDEIGLLAQTFNQMTAHHREMVATLEQRISDRTRALQASFEVSQRLATVQNLDELVARVVDEIRSAFDYYHVQIYLFDDSMEYLVMQGGTGEAGRLMLEQGYKLLNGSGLVGRAAETGETVYVPNTSEDASWIPNPLLTETKCEAAVPLISADQVLGVLDVQIDHPEGLEATDVALLQSIANQVGVAVQNARRLDTARADAVMEAEAVAITEKIQAAASVEAVLEIAIRELSESLRARHGNIRVAMKGVRS